MPIVGALVSGAVAVLIALALGSPLTALLMLIVVIVVQQIESDIVGPLLLGNAVKLHPWAVLAVVSIGTYLFGIVGALFAVPVLAGINAGLFSEPDDDPDAEGRSQTRADERDPSGE